MPHFTFTTPIDFEKLTGASVTEAVSVRDEDPKRIVVELQFETNNGGKHPQLIRLAVTNGKADGIDGQFKPIELTEGMDHAFDQVMGGYVTGGKPAMLTAMAQLGIIPPGSVS